MDKSKENVERQLYMLLDECLESCGQDGTIEQLDYDPETETVKVVFPVHFVEEDNSITFASY